MTEDFLATNVGHSKPQNILSEYLALWVKPRHGKRFGVRADDKLTAFVELARAIDKFAVDLIS